MSERVSVPSHIQTVRWMPRILSSLIVLIAVSILFVGARSLESEDYTTPSVFNVFFVPGKHFHRLSNAKGVSGVIYSEFIPGKSTVLVLEGPLVLGTVEEPELWKGRAEFYFSGYRILTGAQFKVRKGKRILSGMSDNGRVLTTDQSPRAHYLIPQPTLLSQEGDKIGLLLPASIRMLFDRTKIGEEHLKIEPLTEEQYTSEREAILSAKLSPIVDHSLLTSFFYSLRQDDGLSNARDESDRTKESLVKRKQESS
jgi:hypothetical protein